MLRSTLLSALLVVFCGSGVDIGGVTSTAVAAPVYAVVSTVFGNYLPAYLIWDGGAEILITVTKSEGIVYTFSRFNVGQPFRNETFQEVGGPQLDGFNVYKNTIIPVQPATSTITNGDSLRLTLNPSPGFLPLYNTSIFVDVGYYCNSGIPDGQIRVTFDIVPSPEKSNFLVNVVYGTDENEVRQYGFRIEISLIYNLFKTFPTITVVNKIPTSVPAFTTTVTNNGSKVVLTTAPLLTYNISTGSVGTINFQIPMTSLKIPSLLSDNFTVTTKPVDLLPRTFCYSNATTIDEGSVRNGNKVYVEISLSDPSKENFRVGSAFPNNMTAQAVCDLVISGFTMNQLPDMIVECTLVNSTRVVLAISTAVDVVVSGSMLLVVPPTALSSLESGCGIITITMYPDPGVITGPSTALALTELEINEQDTYVTFTIDKDTFLAPSYIFERVLLEETTGTDSKSNYFTETAAQKTQLIISSDGTNATLVLKKDPRYNIEYNTKERIRVVFQANGLLTGLSPILVRCEFTISGVVPSYNVTIDGYTNTSVRLDQLWNSDITPLKVYLNIRGDRWDNASASKWTYRHPFFSGTESFDSLHTVTSSALLFNNLSIVQEGHTAIIPFRSMIGLSLRADSLVFVSQLVLLLEGSMEVSAKSFRVIKGSPEAIKGTFSGIAEDRSLPLPNLINETVIRLGDQFQVTLDGEIFSNISYTSPYRLLDPTATLYRFPSSITGALNAAKNVLTVTIAPIPDFDIDFAEVMLLRVPDNFYENVIASNPVLGRINVQNLPGPKCSINGLNDITELNIKNQNVDFFVSSTTPFVANVPMSVGISSTSHGLKVIVVSRNNDNNITLRIQQNSTYEIVDPDPYTIVLPRTFFVAQEKCTGNFSYTILVQAAAIDFMVMAPYYERELRNGTTVVSVTAIITGEQTSSTNFFITAVPNVPSVASQNLLYQELLRIGDSSKPGIAAFNATKLSSGDNFHFYLPTLSQLDITQNQSIRWEVPVSIFASRRTPSYTNNIFAVIPQSEDITFTYKSNVTEQEVVYGGIQISMYLKGDGFNLTGIIADIQNNWKLFDSTGTPISVLPLSRMFPASSFNITKNNVTMKSVADEEFNIVDEFWTLEVFLSGAGVQSGTSPTTTSFSMTIISEIPSLVYSGPALNGGSRDLLRGLLYLDVELLNDKFVSKPTTDICPLPCTITMDSFQRKLKINFAAANDFYLERETNYTIIIPNATVVSATTLPNITMKISIQGGILDPVAQFSTSEEFSEDVFRKGTMTSFLLTIKGDKFKRETQPIVNAIASGIRCFPDIDEFDFCHRFPFMVNRVEVGVSQQQATVYLQADDKFDVSRIQRVVFGLSGIGFQSNLAPLTLVEMSFSIKPTTGTVFCQMGTPSTISDIIAAENSLDPNVPTLNVAFMFTLYGERFIDSPTVALIDGFSVVPADQEQGFSPLRQQLFNDAIVSSDRRQATIRMRQNSNYRIVVTEIITLLVSGSAVASGLAPTVVSNANAFTIALGGGLLELISDKVVYAADVAANGITISLRNTVQWDSLHITESSLIDVFVPEKSVAEEPNGYARYKSTMTVTLPSGTTTGALSLDIKLAANPNYALRKREKILIQIPVRFNVNKAPFIPTTLAIAVDPAYRPLVVVYGSIKTNADLANDIGVQLGISPSRVIVSRETDYGDTKKAYKIAYVVIVNEGHIPIVDSVSGVDYSATQDSITSAETFESSKQIVLLGCCNVSLVFWADAMPALSAVDVMLGLAAPEETVSREDSLTWVYVALGCLGLLLIVVFVLYRMYKNTTDGGRNRVQNQEPHPGSSTLTRRKVLANHLGHDDGEELLIRHGELLVEEEDNFSNGFYEEPKSHRAAGTLDHDEFMGPSLSGVGGGASRKKHIGIVGNHKVTHDVDERLHSGQPSSQFNSLRAPTATPATQRQFNENSSITLYGHTEESLAFNPEEDGISIYPETFTGDEVGSMKANKYNKRNY